MADKKELVDPWDKLGIQPTNIGWIPDMLDIAFAMDKKFTVCLVGETGIGKTPIVQQWVQERNGYIRMFNFGHATQEEVSMIMFDEKGESFDFIPPGWLLDLNAQAEKTGCAVLFLDEWNRGDKALVNALFTLTDERRIHNYKLHDNVLVVAAMNPSDGQYLVNEAEKDHAIRKRLNFIYTVPDLSTWYEYTKKSAWFSEVPSFVMANNTFFYDRGARDAGKCFACPSNWEKVSTLLLTVQSQNKPIVGNRALDSMIVGQIGHVAGTKFCEYLRDKSTAITPEEIIKQYTNKNKNSRTKVLKMLGLKLTTEKDPKTKQFMTEKIEGANIRHDIISELCKSLSIVLFSEMPTVSKGVAKNLAYFLWDLPPELLQSFAAEHLLSASEEKGQDGEKYLNELSGAMQQFQVYKLKMKEIVQAVARYRDEKGLNSEDEPF